jgi:large subunit ribosomal protein L29
MKAVEIREMRDDELRDKLDDIQKQLFALRGQAVTEKLEDSHAIRNVRRDIARIKTIMREKQLGGK